MCLPKYHIKKEKTKQIPELNYGVIVKKRAPSFSNLDPVPIQIKGKKGKTELEPSYCMNMGTTQKIYKSD